MAFYFSFWYSVPIFSCLCVECPTPEGFTHQSQHRQDEAYKQQYKDEDNMPEADDHGAVILLMPVVDFHPMSKQLNHYLW